MATKDNSKSSQCPKTPLNIPTINSYRRLNGVKHVSVTLYDAILYDVLQTLFAPKEKRDVWMIYKVTHWPLLVYRSFECFIS